MFYLTRAAFDVQPLSVMLRSTTKMLTCYLHIDIPFRIATFVRDYTSLDSEFAVTWDTLRLGIDVPRSSQWITL